MIAVIGIGVYSGNSGIISFGNVGFMAIGAYASGLLTINPIVQKTALPHLPEWLMGWGMPLLPALLAALVVVALVAITIGIPVARLAGSSASICTLGFPCDRACRAGRFQRFHPRQPDVLRHSAFGEYLGCLTFCRFRRGHRPGLS